MDIKSYCEQMKTLTPQDLKNLRNNITLNSLYINDYKNRYNINPAYLINFFDGYIEYLQELAQENNEKNIDFFDLIKNYDTPQNLIDYYNIIKW